MKNLTLELCGRCKIKYSVPCSLLFDGVQNSIRYLRLAFCSFRPTAELGPLRSLTSLSLYLVNISGQELEFFLSNSPALERLDLTQCKEIIFLKIPRVMQQLSCLDVTCSELRVIESEGQNLSWFFLRGGWVENVSLGETLQMENFSMHRSDLVCYTRTELPVRMPNLEALSISSSCERVDTPMLPTKFMFLKYLSIYMVITGASFCPSYDYFSLVSFLDASPLLETLTLDVTQHWMKHELVF